MNNNMEKIIIVDICEYMSFFIEFLKRNDFLRSSVVVDKFISSIIDNLHLKEDQIQKLKNKLMFKTRDMINRCSKLRYIKIIDSKPFIYKITDKKHHLNPLILNLFNSKISNFTI